MIPPTVGEQNGGRGITGEGGMGQAYKWGGIIRRGLCRILIPFLGLAALHRMAWISTSNLAGTDLSSPIKKNGALCGVQGKHSLTPRIPPACS